MLRLKQRVYNYFFFLLSSLALASCGGGGDPSVPDNLDELGLTSVTLTIALANNSTTSPELSQTQDNFVNVTVVDQSGNPIVGEIVTLATTLGTVSGNGQGLTNSNGTAVFEIELTGALAGNGGTLTASYANDQFNIAAEAELDVQAGAPAAGPAPSFAINASVLVPNSTTTTTVLDPDNGNVVSILLTDNGQPAAAGQRINLSTSIGSISPTTISTNAQGIAQATLVSSGISAGTAGVITAAYIDGTEAVIASTQLVVNAGIGLQTAQLGIRLEPEGSVLSQTGENTVVVTLTDGDNNAIASEIVGLTTNAGTIQGNGTTVTNAQGQASFTLNLDGATEGDAVSLTASYSNTQNNINISRVLNLTAGEPAGSTGAVYSLSFSIAELGAGNTLNPVNGNVITVTLNAANADGSAIVVGAGEIINVGTDIGSLSASQILTTNDSGQATVIIDSSGVPGGQAGTISASYTAAGVSEPVTNTIAVQAGSVDETVQFSIRVDGSTATPPIVNQTGTNTVVVTLTDQNDLPLANRTISLEASPIGTVQGNGLRVTDNSGEAQFIVTLSGALEDDAGVFTARFTDEDAGIDASETINFEAGEPGNGDSEDPFNVAVTVTNDATPATPITELDPDQGNPVQIILTSRDGDDEAVRNQVILLGTTIGVVSPSIVLTNNDGEAFATLTSSNVPENQAGSITASFNDGSDTYTDIYNVEAGTSDGGGSSGSGDANLRFVVRAPDNSETRELDPDSGNRIVIELLDNSDTPAALEFRLVTVTTTIGTLDPVSGLVLTDTDGIATINITTEGLTNGDAGVITVTYEDLSQSIFETRTLNVQVGATTGAAETLLTTVLYDAGDYLEDPTTATSNTSADSLTQINAIQPAIFEATLTQGGVPVPDGAVINVSTTLGELSPSSGNILTNDGVATLVLSIGDAEPGEAGSIVATTGSISSQALNFSIGSSNLALGASSGNTFIDGDLTIDATPNADGTPEISANGQTEISVNIVNTTDQEYELYNDFITIEFDSDCIEAGLANIDSPINTSDGTATTNYTPNGCESDTIIATIQNVNGPIAAGDLVIEASTSSSIAFVGANPPAIALKGTGGNGRQESSEVTFQIIDNTGNPEPGVLVNFDLSTETGGVSLVEESSRSDANGNVIARVESGNIPTPVRVSATVDGTSITTVSDVLVISTGLPDQRSFSLSAAEINAGGGSVDGVTTEVTIRAADAFNNLVPDGTAINFTTEYGAIVDACTTVDGLCSVQWNSQSPRSQINYSADNLETTSCTNFHNGTFSITTTGMPCRNPTFAIPNGDFSRVIAYAIGEETFVDANANGVYDSGEIFEDLPEAFVDHNDSGDFSNPNTTGSCVDQGDCIQNANLSAVPPGGEEETFIDFDTDGDYDRGNSIYNGSLCSDTAEADGDCTKTLVNVWDSLNIVMSRNQPYFALYNGNALIGGTGTSTSGGFETSPTIDFTGQADTVSTSLTLFISDIHNGPLPQGTSINVGGTNCDVTPTASYEFSETTSNMISIPITLSPDTTRAETGSINVTVSVPDNNGGIEQIYSFSCID